MLTVPNVWMLAGGEILKLDNEIGQFEKYPDTFRQQMKKFMVLRCISDVLQNLTGLFINL